MRIRAEKDFWAGLLYVGLATGFLWFGREYRVGTASRMGPGYFPQVLGWLFFAIGAASIGRSLFVDGGRIGGIAFKPLAIVSVAIAAFALLLQPAGLIFALPILVALSAMASSQTVYDLKSLLILILLTAFCILVFVKGLGVPMPILGSWFDGLVPSFWQR